MESNGKTWTREELVALILQVVQMEVDKAIKVHNSTTHSLLENNVRNLQQLEPKVVLCENVEKKLIERLSSAEETMADEIGRAQDVAKAAVDKAEEAFDNSSRAVGIAMNGNNAWQYGSFYQQPPTGWRVVSSSDPTMSSTIELDTSNGAHPLTTFNLEQVQQVMKSNLPQKNEALAMADKLIAQKDGSNKVSTIEWTADPVNPFNSVLEVNGKNRSCTLQFDPTLDKWMLQSVCEVSQLDTNKTKKSKKGKK